MSLEVRGVVVAPRLGFDKCCVDSTDLLVACPRAPEFGWLRAEEVEQTLGLVEGAGGDICSVGSFESQSCSNDVSWGGVWFTEEFLQLGLELLGGS
jgi:hypothetical protein